MAGFRLEMHVFRRLRIGGGVDDSPMDDVALANYVAGTYFGHVEAGRLDPDCAKMLGVKPYVEIWFSDYTLLKLRKRHGDINFSRLHLFASDMFHCRVRQ
jgi:hypothetical protein